MQHDDEPINPIVAMATKIRARRDLGAAIDSATAVDGTAAGTDAQTSFGALAETLATGTKRLNSILGRDGVTFIRMEKPPRVRLRFRGKRIALDLDAERQLVVIAGEELDGSYQFDPSADTPTLVNVSRVSTEEGYGEALTPSGILKQIARDAELPRPAHLDEPGPLRF